VESGRTDGASLQNDDTSQNSDTSKATNKWERLKEHNAQLKTQLDKAKDSLQKAETKLEELQSSEEFDDLEEKEDAIADAKATISYQKNRLNELNEEVTSSRESSMNELKEEYALSEAERTSLDSFANLSKYKGLDPEEVFALYHASKGGKLQLDEAKIHQRESVSLI
jgi:predicted RNase H-like nuclease (RuvC/YqgF family)